MKVIHSLTGLRREHRPIFLAAGFFDGVHRGHQAVIRRAMAEARKAGGSAWVMTFDTHPRKVLHPERAPRLLTSPAHKLRLFEELGVDGAIVIPFTPKLAQQQPEDFVTQLVRAAHSLALIAVGRNWTFGRNGEGNAVRLKTLGQRHGFRVAIVPPISWKHAPISSTRIRQHIQDGNLIDAARMLGRHYSILGTVKSGQKIGRTLNAPTANLDPHNEVYPPNGVYVARAMLKQNVCHGILNLGTRPTLSHHGRHERLLELHLFDIHRNLYRQDIEAFFLMKLREETQFATMAALKQQIACDIAKAHTWLKTTHKKK